MSQRSAQPDKPDRPERREFHHAHSSLGAIGTIGQVIKTAGILAPLFIGEFVKDADKRWRWIRISSVATALVSQALYTSRVQQDRQRCEDRSWAERCRPASDATEPTFQR